MSDKHLNIVLVILGLTLLAEFFLSEYKNIAPDETFYYNLGRVLGGLVTAVVTLTIANKLLDIPTEYDKRGLAVLLGSIIIFNFSGFQGLWQHLIYYPFIFAAVVMLDYFFYKKDWRFSYLGGVYLAIILIIILGG